MERKYKSEDVTGSHELESTGIVSYVDRFSQSTASLGKPVTLFSP